MKDRISANPGRVKMTKSDGTSEYVTLERADNPSVTGTALSKANLLTDAVSKAIMGDSSDYTINEVLNKLNTLISTNTTNIANGVKIATGSYTGTGTYGSSNPCSLTFDFAPELIIIARPGSSSYGGFPWIRGSTLVNSTLSGETVTITWASNSVSWYSRIDNSNQLNLGITYYYLAIG
jgi:hypothetical protein